VRGSGFRVQGPRCRVQGSRFTIHGVRCGKMVPEARLAAFAAQGLGFKILSQLEFSQPEMRHLRLGYSRN
jgi:hypothetical protein